MSTSKPVCMILPSILLVGLLLTALSLFTGSAYAQLDPKPNDHKGQSVLELGDKYPDTIQKWKNLIEEAGKEYNTDPNLIAAVMLQESGGNHLVLSSSGAVGLLQVMPKDGIAASFLCDGKSCFSKRPTIEELLQPDFNVDYGTRMLTNLINKNNGSLRKALYQYGPMDVGYYYADIVLAIYERYQ